MATIQEFEAVQEEIPPSFSVTLDLQGLGLSLINKRLVEIVYLSAQNLKLEYSNSPVAQSANIAIGTLQIDNQLHDAFFPVLLQPTPIAKEDRGLAALPTVQASVIILNDSGKEAFNVLFGTFHLTFDSSAWRTLREICVHPTPGPHNSNRRGVFVCGSGSD